MSDFLKKYFEQAAKTDIFTSFNEEKLRYMSPSILGKNDIKRWILLNIASYYEWLPRLKWMRKGEED